ncbi:TetR/AcrR family transcriptional regulator [Bacillus ndiopicus]|uniref:TetR/AcrR family transcriptional regulator n=1 Tax=Bacillus ndiopicus TaxID=1347368 RepID=UPI000693A188|nr:TetR family transcriptional regulator [Bacillus ndiopicus]
MYSTNNPIAIQSQKWLVTALLDLMKEKPFDAITVKEVAKKADLDRSTFYRNFKTKEDILNLYLNKLAEEYTNRLVTAGEIDMRKVSKIFLEFMNEHIDLICSLRKNGLSSFLLDAFNRCLPTIHALTQDKFPHTISEENLEFALAFNAGGMWNILMKWIDEDFIHSTTDLIRAFDEISYFNYKQ